MENASEKRADQLAAAFIFKTHFMRLIEEYAPHPEQIDRHAIERITAMGQLYRDAVEAAAK